MLIEHFVEPDALVELAKSRRNCKDFLREFSRPSPRVLGEFPKLKKLRSLALQGQRTDASEGEKKRLEELLEFLRDSSRVVRSITFDGSLRFQENLKIAEQQAFRGIHILRDHLNEYDLKSEILCVDHFEQGLDPLPSQCSVPRVAESLCAALKEFLRLSKKISLIDPFFGTKSGFWKTFLLLLRTAAESSPVADKRFEVLFDGSKKNAASCEYLADTLRKENEEIYRLYSQITFKDIRENGQVAVHNRYLMSELGGVSLGHGFEESNEREFDDVTLLSASLYQERYRQYIELQGIQLHGECSL